MNDQVEILDTEELQHLALQAIGEADSEGAIGYLKRLLALEPEEPTALYLLGAVHAEIGLAARATTEIARAIERGIDLPVAHFQLGMLRLRAGDLDAAAQAWQPLDALGEEDPHFRFKRGMLHLAAERIDDFLADVGRGIELNTDDDALNENMREIMKEVRLVTAAEGAAPGSVEPAADEPDESVSGAAGRLLSKYGDGE